jgi:hypothetical protein
MKRVHILERPTPVSDINDYDMEDYSGDWSTKAERVRLKRWRRVKQQLA